MRIAICFPVTDMTGGSKMGLELCRRFVAAGDEVLAFCATRPADAASSVLEPLAEAGVQMVMIENFHTRWVQLFPKFLSECRKFGVTSIFSLYQADVKLMAALSFALRCPLFIYDQNKKTFGGGSVSQAAKNFLYNLTVSVSATKVFCISDILLEEQRNRLLFGKHRATRSSSGIDVAAMTVKPFPNGAANNGTGTTFVNVGRLDPQKGQDILIRAIGGLPRDSGIKVLLVGASTEASEESTKYSQMLQDLVAELKLENEITFLGWRDDVPQLMRQVDAYVHAARWEGWPLAVMDAMATALPAIFTDCSSAPPEFRNTVDGIMVPAGNIDALTDALKMLLEMSAKARAEMGARGRDLALRRFDAGNIFAELRQEMLHSNG